ncbi:uncharacterized, partial [Tachysurus ichikawai]
AAVALQEVGADDLWLCVLGGSWPQSRRQSNEVLSTGQWRGFPCLVDQKKDYNGRR